MSAMEKARSRGFGAVTVAPLAPGETLSVLDGEATTIRIDRGEVWITEEGSFIDHILRAGQRYTFDRPGFAIVTPQAASRVTLYAPRIGARAGRIATTNRVLYERHPWRTILAILWPSSMLRASRSVAVTGKARIGGSSHYPAGGTTAQRLIELYVNRTAASELTTAEGVSSRR